MDKLKGLKAQIREGDEFLHIYVYVLCLYVHEVSYNILTCMFCHKVNTILVMKVILLAACINTWDQNLSTQIHVIMFVFLNTCDNC